MSDENEQQPEQPEQAPTPYLTRSKMLPVEAVVYCLEHGAVHDDTTDPYNYGQPDCSKDEHRPVYYRGRKGDLDESADGPHGPDSPAAWLVKFGEESTGESRTAETHGGPEAAIVVDDLSAVQERITRRIIAQSSEPLTAEERTLVLWLVQNSADATRMLGSAIQEVFGDDDEGLEKVAHRLELLTSATRKLGGEDGEGGG